MNKQQKYIDYVANDLIKNTTYHINIGNDGIEKFVFINIPMESGETNFNLRQLRSQLKERFLVYGEDEEYLMDKYGTPYDLIQIIYNEYWYRLINRLIKLYPN